MHATFSLEQSAGATGATQFELRQLVSSESLSVRQHHAALLNKQRTTVITNWLQAVEAACCGSYDLLVIIQLLM